VKVPLPPDPQSLAGLATSLASQQQQQEPALAWLLTATYDTTMRALEFLARTNSGMDQGPAIRSWYRSRGKSGLSGEARRGSAHKE
jgi:hypothetical protein